MAQKIPGMKQAEPCTCGSGNQYAQCCGQYLAGQWPETAEQLMRSRYTAFTLNADDYLLQTWHKKTRPPVLDLSDQSKIKWIGLKVISHNSSDDNAVVEFIARFKTNGRAEKIHERSRFIREGDRWFYVDGEHK